MLTIFVVSRHFWFLCVNVEILQKRLKFGLVFVSSTLGNGAGANGIRQGKGKRGREYEIIAKTNGNEIKSWKM